MTLYCGMTTIFIAQRINNQRWLYLLLRMHDLWQLLHVIAQCTHYINLTTDPAVQIATSECFGSADTIMMIIYLIMVVHIHIDALTYLNAAVTRSQYLANGVPSDCLELIGLASAHFTVGLIMKEECCFLTLPTHFFFVNLWFLVHFIFFL